jgi:hypothetical protein
MQAVVVTGPANPNQNSIRLALYGPDGSPLSLGLEMGLGEDPDDTEIAREFDTAFTPGAELDPNDGRLGTFVAYTVVISAIPGDTVAVILKSTRMGAPALARVGLDRGGETPGGTEALSIEGTLSALISPNESIEIEAIGDVNNIGFIGQTETPLLPS